MRIGNKTIGRLSPSFLIIGVQKGGTSSLYEYLIKHPSIEAPSKKELHYFDTPVLANRKTYLSHFPYRMFSSKISFEATPKYMYYPTAAKRIFDFDPSLKLIVVLRDPVKRAYSAWNMYRQFLKSKKWIEYFKKVEEAYKNERFFSCFYADSFPSFEEWIEVEMHTNFSSKYIEPSIIRRGYYSDQIKAYLRFFSKNHILFMDSHLLSIDTYNQLLNVCDFLEIPRFEKESFIQNNSHNRRAYVTPLKKDTYHRLWDHYSKKNKDLRELTSIDFDWLKTPQYD